MSNIISGTADVTNGSDTIVWHGDPLWITTSPVDSQVVLDGLVYYLLSLPDTTHVQLSREYSGTTASGIPAEISPYTDAQVSTVSLQITNSTLIRLLSTMSALGIQPDKLGLLANRDLWDDQKTNFVYLSLDGDGDTISTPVYYIKNSDTSGDWSDAYDLRGLPGADGATVEEVLAELGVPAIIVSTSDPSGSAADNTIWFKIPG
jgi:hypothetical protein